MLAIGQTYFSFYPIANFSMVNIFSVDEVGLCIIWANTSLFIILGKLPTLNLPIKSHPSLKLVSPIFYRIFIFSSNDKPSKTMKNFLNESFLFHLKSFFVIEIFTFLQFFPFLSTLSRFKRANRSGIIYDVIIWLA